MSIPNIFSRATATDCALAKKSPQFIVKNSKNLPCFLNLNYVYLKNFLWKFSNESQKNLSLTDARLCAKI